MVQRVLSGLLAFVFSIMPFGYRTGIEDPYLELFKKYCGGKYVGVSLDGVKLADTARLAQAMQAYCDEHGTMLLLDTYDGLKQKGYIKKIEYDDADDYEYVFEDGVYLWLSDELLSINSFAIYTGSYYAALAGSGYRYDVKRILGTWRIVKSTFLWIS